MRAFVSRLIPFALWCQHDPPATRSPSFYVETHEEDWFPDGRRSERIVRTTRLADKSYLSIRPYAGPMEPAWRLGHEYFYLVDRAKLVAYSGDVLTKAAYPLVWKNAADIPDPYGNCSVLSDPASKATEAGTILSYQVWRIEPNVAGRRPEETFLEWVAPDLGCFALRSQVLVDHVVRERVEAVKIKVLPEDTKLTLPKGIRVVSPNEYYELYRKRHRGDQVFPPALRERLQRTYEENHPPGNGK